MRIEDAQVILTSKLPDPDIPWEGKLMAVVRGDILYLSVAFIREGGAPLPHRDILEAAGIEGIRRGSPDNFGGCLLKVFMGTVVMNGCSGDFGVIQKQEVLLPRITSALRKFFHDRKIEVHEIDTDALDR